LVTNPEWSVSSRLKRCLRKLSALPSFLARSAYSGFNLHAQRARGKTQRAGAARRRAGQCEAGQGGAVRGGAGAGLATNSS